GANPALNPRLPIAAPENDNVYLVAGDVSVTPATPERIRGVQLRLTTRARAPDRDVDLPPGTDGRRVRFLVDTGGPVAQYARPRTLYADVALPNAVGVQW